MPPDKPVKVGPNGQPVRPFIMPASFSGKLHVWHLLLIRRAVQLGILLLFIGTVRWGWEMAGSPVLTGNLSSSELFGLIPLADPFATLQILLTGHLPLQEVLLGAAIILVVPAQSTWSPTCLPGCAAAWAFPTCSGSTATSAIRSWHWR
jgi:ferredoxin-type protein NapH